MMQRYEYLLAEAEKLAGSKKLLTQSAARNIFRQYGVPVSEFPNFIPSLDEDIHRYVFLLLSIAFVAKKENPEDADRLFSLAGELLEYVYHNDLLAQNRDYYLLLASLVYYNGRQYSKSYLLLSGNVKTFSQLSYIISLFLKKNFYQLEHELARWMIFSNEEMTNERQVYTKMVAMSLSSILRYLQYGDDLYQSKSVELLDDAKSLAWLDRNMSLWWILHLLQNIIKKYLSNSLWSALNFSDDMLGGEVYRKYIHNLIFGHRIPVVELFPSQILAVQNGLTQDKCVISLPTSSGKTRIAEIAIVKQLTVSPDSKVLYLAPFRSLAYEIEEVMSRSLEPLGYVVSHLYGGCFYTSRDSDEMESSHVIIATPEKAKAIYRYTPEAFTNIGLIVFDEGHLIGPDSRSTKNELFSEELHVLADKQSIKLLLLSAVLPNVQSISTWISGSPDAYIQSKWRPASQRFGLLVHERKRKEFDIFWNGGEYYNRHFMKCRAAKNSAIAQAATRFSSTGSILLYVGQKKSTLSISRELYKLNNEDVFWGNTSEWKRFELICLENHEDEIYQWAKKGILCHHGALQSDVRLAMESLLRSGKAKYIVATNTLAQGVNLGVSMVIFVSTLIGKGQFVSKRDFWNIVGRAGRAFVETEGTILFYKDGTDVDSRKSAESLKRINEYFDQSKIEKANSGLLFLVRQLLVKAEEMDIGGAQLLEMVANDHCSILNDPEFDADTHFDDIDDSLLSIMLLAGSETQLDDKIRKMLAYIQARDTEEQAFVRQFIHARCKWLKKSISSTLMQTFSGTGIPIREAHFLNNYRLKFREIALRHVELEGLSVDDICEILLDVETLFQENEIAAYKCKNLTAFVEVLPKWISGECLSEEERIAFNAYFTYMFPWLLNAVAVMYHTEDEEISKLYSDVAAYCQYGLQSNFAIKLYLQGIRSRQVCTNLSKMLDPVIGTYTGWRLLKRVLRNKELIIQNPACSNLTKQWLELLQVEATLNNRNQDEQLDKLSITLQGVPAFINQLFLCKYRKELFISDATGEFRYAIDDIPDLSTIANTPGIYLKRTTDNVWTLTTANPNYRFRE